MPKEKLKEILENEKKNNDKPTIDVTEENSFLLLDLPPRKKRLQDKTILFLFFLALCSLCVLSVIGFRQGNPERYIYGADSWGNVCGRRNNPSINGALLPGLDHSGRPYSFYFITNDARIPFYPEIVATQKYATICTSECQRGFISCQGLLIKEGYVLPSNVTERRICTMLADLILPQRLFYGSCVPVDLGQINSSQLTSALQRFGRNYTSTSELDVYTAPSGPFEVSSLTVRFLLLCLQRYWIDVVGLVFVGLAITLVVVALLQAFGRYFMIGGIIVSGVGSVAMTMVFWYNYFLSGASAPYDPGQPNLNLSQISSYLEVYSISKLQYLLFICLLMTLFSVIIVTTIIVLRKRLYVSLSFFDETAMYSVLGLPLIFLQPLVTSIMILAVIAYSVTAAVYIASYQEVSVDADGFVFYSPKLHPPTWFLLILHVSISVWLLEFIYACQDIAIAGTIARWYFSRDRRKFHFTLLPILPSNGNLIRYGLGVAASGSIAINIAQTLRIFTLRNANHSSESAIKLESDPQPPGCQCCDGNWPRFCHRGAYIWHAIFGDDFYESGKRAYWLALGYHRHLIVLNAFSNLSIFLIKILVLLFTLFVAIMWIHEKSVIYPIAECFLPILIVCCAAFVFASAFLNVYIIAFDTVFLCYCLDELFKKEKTLEENIFSSKAVPQVFRSPTPPPSPSPSPPPLPPSPPPSPVHSPPPPLAPIPRSPSPEPEIVPKEAPKVEAPKVEATPRREITCRPCCAIPCVRGIDAKTKPRRTITDVKPCCDSSSDTCCTFDDVNRQQGRDVSSVAPRIERAASNAKRKRS